MGARLAIMWLVGLGAVFAGVTLLWGYATGLIVAGGLTWGEYMLGSLSVVAASSRRADK